MIIMHENWRITYDQTILQNHIQIHPACDDGVVKRKVSAKKYQHCLMMPFRAGISIYTSIVEFVSLSIVEFESDAIFKITGEKGRWWCS
jgi:hypothetical protein